MHIYLVKKRIYSSWLSFYAKKNERHLYACIWSVVDYTSQWRKANKTFVYSLVVYVYGWVAVKCIIRHFILVACIHEGSFKRQSTIHVRAWFLATRTSLPGCWRDLALWGTGSMHSMQCVRTGTTCMCVAGSVNVWRSSLAKDLEDQSTWSRQCK